MFKNLLKKFINHLLSLFNLKIIKKNVFGIIDKRNLTPFQKNNVHAH